MNAKEHLQRLRNLGVIAHIDAGKTTTTERILYFSGISHRIGEVDEGTAVMDWMDQERERGITITSAVTSTSWRDHTLNIVDTPGHVDFTAEVQRSLRVLDGAVVVICGVGGVEPQSEKVWHQATEYRVPRIVFINKLDRLGADFERALEDCRAKLTGTFVPLAVPLDRDEGYLRSLDLLRGTVLTWTTDQADDEPAEGAAGDDLREILEAGRERLVEAAALGDESVLDAFLESGTFEPDRVLPALRKAVLGGDVHPVLSGTSLKNRGVRRLLDAVVDFLPSPLEVPPVEGLIPGTERTATRNPNPQLPLAALVYKVMNDESRSRLYYTRLYAGTLERGVKLWNPDQGLEERVTRIYRMHSNRKEALEKAVAGDIVCLVGPKRTVTGDTFCTKDDPLLLEPIAFPEPVIAAAIEPKSQGDLADLEKALSELAVEDPTFTVKDDPETGQKIVAGMGELHLEVLVTRLAREFRLEARLGQPQVSYRETVSGSAQETGRFDREIADKPNRAAVTLKVEAADRNEGFRFTNRTSEEAVPAGARRLIESACRDAAGAGPFAGYAMIDLWVTLIDADLPGDAATEIAVRSATADAFRRAARAAGPLLLEPVVRIEVTVPEEYAGDGAAGSQRRAAPTSPGTDEPREAIEKRDLRHRPAVPDVRIRDRPEVPHARARDLLDGDLALRAR